MSNFEQGFSDTERAADLAAKSATGLAKLAKQLQKAAKEGNIVAIGRTQDRLDAALGNFRQTIANAAQSWPFENEEEEHYLDEDYADELRRTASERGLEIHEQDGRLISHPSIVRILPRDRAVRIDRKKVSTIRPSYLVDLLIVNQNKGSRFPAGRFIEALYEVYSELVKEDSAGRLVEGVQGRVVQLSRIYKLLTSLPGSNRDYTPTDFARDLYLLDTSGLTKTRSGATVSFPASTGTRGTKGLFTFVGPDGRDVQYYGVRFTKTY